MLITCRFFARTLSNEETIQVILPDRLRKNTGEKAPVLYLLHGLLGNYTDWNRYTALERYAKKYNIAIVMASAQNSFYHNLPGGKNYFDYIARELPEYVCSILPISENREDNFIAGLSMGGYGALYIALKNLDKFSHVGCFSGAVDFYESIRSGKYQDLNPLPTDENPFEVFDDIDESSDLFFILKNLNRKKLPPIFISCGKQDYIYDEFCKMKNTLTELNVKFFSQDGDGNHDWDYWDKQIQDFLEWLPIDKMN